MLRVVISLFLLFFAYKCSAFKPNDGIIYIEFDGEIATANSTILIFNQSFAIVIKSTSKQVHNITNIKCHYTGNEFQSFTKNENGKWDQEKHVYTVQEGKAEKKMNNYWNCIITYYDSHKMNFNYIDLHFRVTVKNKDVDECNASPRPCSTNANCTNTPYSYECTCLPGYEGNGIHCEAVCALKSERGPCHNYSVYWFFDTGYGGCSRFWYGGCEGNGNRFHTKEECEDTCVSPPPKGCAGYGATTILIVIIVTIVLTSIFTFVIFQVLFQRRVNKARVVDQVLPNPTVDESYYETVDSSNDVSQRAPCPLPAEELEENEKYVHYDTPYEWRIWRFGVNPYRRAQPPRRPGSQNIQ